MGDLRQRPYGPDDAPAMAALMNLIEQHAGGHGGFDGDDVRLYLDHVVGDHAANTRLVFDPGGDLVAAAVTTPPPPGGFRVDMSGGVHPAWRGRGLGRDLLAAQLARAGELHAARGDASNEPWRAQAGAILADEDSQRLFRRFGMSPIRYWFDMVAPTAGAPALPVPDGLTVVAYPPGHEAALAAAHEEAFADHWGHQPRRREDWLAISVGSASFEPRLSLLAFDGEDLAGYILSYRDPDPTRLYIGQVGVRRPWRRRGLASALLSEVLTAAGRAGLQRASLGVDADNPTGAVGVYERVGFAVSQRAVSYSRPL